MGVRITNSIPVESYDVFLLFHVSNQTYETIQLYCISIRIRLFLNAIDIYNSANQMQGSKVLNRRICIGILAQCEYASNCYDNITFLGMNYRFKHQ